MIVCSVTGSNFRGVTGHFSNITSRSSLTTDTQVAEKCALH
jgi:hypothetical protein